MALCKAEGGKQSGSRPATPATRRGGAEGSSLGQAWERSEGLGHPPPPLSVLAAGALPLRRAGRWAAVGARRPGARALPPPAFLIHRTEGLVDSFSQGPERLCPVSGSVLHGIEPRLKDFHQLLLSPPKVEALAQPRAPLGTLQAGVLGKGDPTLYSGRANATPLLPDAARGPPGRRQRPVRRPPLLSVRLSSSVEPGSRTFCGVLPTPVTLAF